MKFFLSSLFLILSTHLAWADFKSTTLNLGAAPKSTPLRFRFLYQNTSTAAVVLRLEKNSSESGECRASNYTTHPIAPNKSGEVFVSCSFKTTGPKHHQVARVNGVSLAVKAQVTEQASCSDMDLNLGSPLTKMPVLDQDGMGICYAFTSTQLVEFQLRSRGVNRSLSPIDASFMHKSKLESSQFVLTAGVTKHTIDKIIEDGVASRECVNRVIAKHTRGTVITSEEFLALIEKIYIARRKNVSPKNIKAELKDTCDAYGVTPSEFDKLAKSLERPFKEYLSNVLDECEKERDTIAPIKGIKYNELSQGTNQEIQFRLNRILDHRIPATTSICAEIIQGKPQHRGIVTSGERNQIKDASGKKLCANHSVLVTARRKVNNKCEYLLRNSWGGSWKQKGLICACRTDKAYYPDCSKNKENSGNKVMVGCWVGQDSLIPNTSTVGGFAE